MSLKSLTRADAERRASLALSPESGSHPLPKPAETAEFDTPKYRKALELGRSILFDEMLELLEPELV